MIMAKHKGESDEFLVPSDILEASRRKAKVQYRVIGLPPRIRVTSTTSISMLESSIVPSILQIESTLSSHMANINNSVVAARAVENCMRERTAYNN